MVSHTTGIDDFAGGHLLQHVAAFQAAFKGESATARVTDPIEMFLCDSDGFDSVTACRWPT